MLLGHGEESWSVWGGNNEVKSLNELIVTSSHMWKFNTQDLQVEQNLEAYCQGRWFSIFGG